MVSMLAAWSCKTFGGSWPVGGDSGSPKAEARYVRGWRGIEIEYAVIVRTGRSCE